MKLTDDAGFTLVELLIVILILGLITGIVTGAVSFGVRSRDATSEQDAAFARIEAAQRFLREQLHGALLVDGANTVMGTSDEVTFAAILPEQFGVGGSHWFHLSETDVDGVRSLALEWRPLSTGSTLANSGPSSTQKTLLSGTSGLKLSYFGAAEDASERDWHDSWSSAVRAPLVVSIEIEFPEGDIRYWPQLLIGAAAPVDSERVAPSVSDDDL